jgi:hypothetical protein
VGAEAVGIGMRSGTDAKREGCVPQYAAHVKATLLKRGQTEAQAQSAYDRIIARFGS